MSAPGTSPRPDPGGGMLLAAFVFGWGGVLVFTGVFTVVLLLVSFTMQGMDPAAALEALSVGGDLDLPAWLLASTLAVQFAGMIALVPAAHLLVGASWYRPGSGRVARPDGWAGVFATRRTWWAFSWLAAAMGLVTGLLPGWVASRMVEAWPSLQNGTLELIDQALKQGGPVWGTALALEVALLAPVIEELVFRGFVWDAMRRFLPLWATWLLSSLMFAAYHMDPVQSVAVVFTGLALGWVRWMSGSVWPAIVLHAVNNSLAVVAAFTLGDVEVGLPLALGAASASIGLWTVAAALRHGRVGSIAADTPLS